MTITLLDENDNPPTFVPQFGYAVSVAENQGVGSVLHTAVSRLSTVLSSVMADCFSYYVPTAGGYGS